MFKLKAICPNIEELNLEICNIDFKYNKNELNNPFPNMKKISVYIRKQFDLIKILKDSQVNTSIIFIFDNDQNVISCSEIKIEIILEQINNLEIYIEDECNINNCMYQFFKNIQFPYLTKYILNFDFT